MLVGVVGKPNTGKSTFFKAATLADVEIANYPFATIKPNMGIGYVKSSCVDKEFGRQCEPREGFCKEGFRFIPIQLIDVAGLVKGAHEGRGLGNEFLNDLNQADVLIHVVDASGSTNEKGEIVQPLSYDPLNDVKFLEDELDLWFLKIMSKNWEKVAKVAQLEKQSLAKLVTKQMSGLRVTEDMVKEAVHEGFPENIAAWTTKEMRQLASILRRRTKPIVIAANKVDVAGAEKNIERLKKTFPHLEIIPCSAAAEVALKEAEKKGLIAYLQGGSSCTVKGRLSKEQEAGINMIKEKVLEKYGSTGVQEVLDIAVFKVLKYFPVFPGSAKLVDKDGKVLRDCFLFKEGSTAEDFAFHIHTDIGKNFIKAVNVRTKKVVGKDYLLQRNDVIEIMTKK